MEIDVARKRLREAETSILRELERCSREVGLPIRRVDVDVADVSRVSCPRETVITGVKIEVNL